MRAPVRSTASATSPGIPNIALVAAVFFGLATVPAAAQTSDPKPPLPGERVAAGGPPPENKTRVSLGLATRYGPEFEGADESEIAPFPIPLITVRNFYRFNFTGRGLSFDLVRQRYDNGRLRLRMGPLVSADFGRDEDDSDFLDGLGDVDTSVLAGGFVDVRYGPVALSVSGGQDIADGHDGARVDMRLGFMIPVGERLRLIPGISTTWASEDYNQSFFGITPTQAANSIYDTFDAESGFKDVGVNLNIRYKIAENWAATGIVSYKRLIGDAADSPIVQGPGGSEDQVSALFGISYSFDFTTP